MYGRLTFVAGVFFETALLVAAFGWALIFGEPMLRDIRWRASHVALGILSAAPVLLFFLWTVKSKLPLFTRHRALLDTLIPRVFGGWPVWQLAVISLCAGICEEALFRGAMQASLAARIGATGAVIAVSLLFGALHLLSWTYGVIAAFLGAYLGLLYVFTGNLLAPMITHAVYDFIVLLCLVRRPRE